MNIHKVGAPAPLPTWALGWLWPELQSPRHIDPHKILLVPHPEQHEDRLIKGTDIMSWLVTTGKLERCLNLTDGLSVIESGTPTFFAGTKVYLWQSVVEDTAQNLLVPAIQNCRGQKSQVYWYWLEYRLYPIHLAALI